MVTFRLVYHIVVTHNVVGFSQRVVDFPVTVPGRECGSDRTSRVQLPAKGSQFAGGSHNLYLFAFNDLITDTPTEDTGMVAVPENHCF